jgi:hypothetical protein
MRCSSPARTSLTNRITAAPLRAGFAVGTRGGRHDWPRERSLGRNTHIAQLLRSAFWGAPFAAWLRRAVQESGACTGETSSRPPHVVRHPARQDQRASRGGGGSPTGWTCIRPRHRRPIVWARGTDCRQLHRTDTTAASVVAQNVSAVPRWHLCRASAARHLQGRGRDFG